MVMARGYIAYSVAGVRFDVPSSYSLLGYVNEGAHGVVCSAVENSSASGDHATGRRRMVAIKRQFAALSTLTSCKRILREICILKQLDHENVVAIRDAYIPQTTADGGVKNSSVCIVTELMDSDLQKILESGQPLSDDHRRYLSYQLVRGVKYIHSAGVVHRDLKPGNLLVNENCDLKICDFGLARMINCTTASPASPAQRSAAGADPAEMQTAPMSPASATPLTDYIATRWYRAPEIMLSWNDYTKAVDMWAVGCIIAELHLGKPLFPGVDEYHQLELITSALGSPGADDLDGMRNSKSRRCLSSIGQKPAQPWRTIVPSADSQAVDMMARLLSFNPKRRMAAAEALRHAYFAPLHDSNDEPEASAPLILPWDAQEMSRTELISLILENLARFRNPGLPAYVAQRGEEQRYWQAATEPSSSVPRTLPLLQKRTLEN